MVSRMIHRTSKSIHEFTTPDHDSVIAKLYFHFNRMKYYCYCQTFNKTL